MIRIGKDVEGSNNWAALRYCSSSWLERLKKTTRTSVMISDLQTGYLPNTKQERPDTQRMIQTSGNFPHASVAITDPCGSSEYRTCFLQMRSGSRWRQVYVPDVQDRSQYTKDGLEINYS